MLTGEAKEQLQALMPGEFQSTPVIADGRSYARSMIYQQDSVFQSTPVIADGRSQRRV